MLSIVHSVHCQRFTHPCSTNRGTQWRSWLRHCATSRKVAGSNPDGVIGFFFHWHPSGHTMTLGLIQPLTEMCTKNISWRVKAAGAYGWQIYHLHVPIVLKSGNLNLLEPSGPVQACNGIALPLQHKQIRISTIMYFIPNCLLHVSAWLPLSVSWHHYTET